MPVKKIGTLIDRLHRAKLAIDTANEEVKKAEAKVAKLKEKYEAIETEIFDSFDKQDIGGARGIKEPYRCEVERKEYPTITDWKKFRAYIVKTGDWDLMEKRPATNAFRARWDDNKSIPGAGKFSKTKLKLTKVR